MTYIPCGVNVAAMLKNDLPGSVRILDVSGLDGHDMVFRARYWDKATSSFHFLKSDEHDGTMVAHVLIFQVSTKNSDVVKRLGELEKRYLPRLLDKLSCQGYETKYLLGLPSYKKAGESMFVRRREVHHSDGE